MKEDAKRLDYNRFDVPSQFSRSYNGKSLKWNIEESKENMDYDIAKAFTSSFSHFSKTDPKGNQTSDYSSKKAWEKSYT